jgi:alkylation response protein AidB-like acyl-CoA dehydrogenase
MLSGTPVAPEANGPNWILAGGAHGDGSQGPACTGASTVKLVCSEMAGRVIDRAVQIFGGRGCMRENPVERLWGELRVDRIWEGTSEIQRAVIGNHLLKRGPRAFIA